MKHVITIFLLALSTQGWSIKASVEFLKFSNVDQQYLEVNYRIFSNSLSMSDDQTESKVLSTIIIYQGEQIVDYQKNMLIGSNIDKEKDLLDVRRFVLDPGEYKVTLELEDQKGQKQIFKVEKRLTIIKRSLKSMSDLMLLATVSQSDQTSAMVRNGLYMEVLPYSFFDRDNSVLTAYMEVYGLQDTDKHYCSYEIINGYDSDAGEVEVVKYKRLDPKSLQAYLLKVDLTDLISGNYHFAVKIFDGDKQLIDSRTVNFVKVNPKADMSQLSKRSDKISNSFTKDIDVDSLNYYLQALAPIVNEPRRSLLDELLKNNNEIAKKRFIYDYWKDSAGDRAEGASIAYMKIARAVDRNFFNGTSYGFDTDMGYIFLRYGKPDDAMIVDDELSSFPYQIWRYHKVLATGENNVKFLFYAPSLSHRDFRLLHSTCRVELQNPSWEAELYRRIPEEQVGNPSEVRTTNDGFTRRARDLWNDF